MTPFMLTSQPAFSSPTQSRSQAHRIVTGTFRLDLPTSDNTVRTASHRPFSSRQLSPRQSVSCDGRGWSPYNRSLSWLLGCLFYHHRGNVCLRNKTQDRVESWNRLPPKHLLVKKGLLTVGVSPPVFPAQRGVGRYLNPSVITLHIKFCILNFSFKCSK